MEVYEPKLHPDKEEVLLILGSGDLAGNAQTRVNPRHFAAPGHAAMLYFQQGEDLLAAKKT